MVGFSCAGAIDKAPQSDLANAGGSGEGPFPGRPVRLPTGQEARLKDPLCASSVCQAPLFPAPSPPDGGDAGVIPLPFPARNVLGVGGAEGRIPAFPSHSGHAHLLLPRTLLADRPHAHRELLLLQGSLGSVQQGSPLCSERPSLPCPPYTVPLTGQGGPPARPA